ncbi:Sugar transport protein 7 [Vitis vinifera]|uniref:Sugar transport protein 7 n=1 Tax=Vitis vinifera TaxID=29760 RepID=A0A438C8C6_VITVI|nr:Sugar transport protein 7 [Vitis vinifera]
MESETEANPYKLPTGRTSQVVKKRQRGKSVESPINLFKGEEGLSHFPWCLNCVGRGGRRGTMEVGDGSFAPVGVSKQRADQYKGRLTTYVVVACLVAAVGGAIFGYDIGVSGGVTSMDTFLEKFFHTVYLKKRRAEEDHYCKYNDQGLAAFTSSLYLAGLVASIVASPITRKYGRRASIVCGGISFLIGAALNAAAVNLAMLLSGRIMLGIGIGFGDQCHYICQRWRRPISRSPEHDVSVSNYDGDLHSKHDQLRNCKAPSWGWRLSLGLAALPAILMTVGGLLLPETPNSLIERGSREKGRRVLERIRGTNEVDAEFEDIVDASELANSIKHPFRNILERRNRPQLVMAICMPAFQILNGINSILFYAPVLFQTMGFGNATLYSSALTGAVLVLSTVVSIGLVDRLGRRVLLISGGIQMVLCQAFGWSWGPLGWTVPSEIFPLETRSAGQSITVAVNLLFTFIIAQCFLSMLFPIEEMIFVWKKHWFWKRMVPGTPDVDDIDGLGSHSMESGGKTKLGS